MGYDADMVHVMIHVVAIEHVVVIEEIVAWCRIIACCGNELCSDGACHVGSA